MKTQTKGTKGTETRGMLHYIPVTALIPHPSNPRKDLGDLTELAASIKENGVLQNMTVVEEKTYEGQPTGSYTVIIGHRRLAAAKMTGLKELPCIVADMGEADQIKTMLMENMQRSDLTVTEQADGFQMMLDLGADVDEIARQSGFSKATIRHRLQLRELDRQKLEQRLSGGATLMDLIKLEEIEDPTSRNKVLESVGSPNFNYELRNALTNQTAKKNKPLWLALMDSFAQKLSKEDCKLKEWTVRSYISYSTDPGQYQKPADADTEVYGYFAEAQSLNLMRNLGTSDKEQEESQEEAALKEKIQETKAALNESSRSAYQLRLDFIRNHNLRQKDVRHTTDYLLSMLVNQELRNRYGGIPNGSTVEVLFNIPSGLGYSETAKLRDAAFSSLLTTDPDKALLWMAYAVSGDGESQKYYEMTWERQFPVYAQNKLLDALYDFLETLGYLISDEERLLMSGEHPAFQPGKEEEKIAGDDEDEDELSEGELDADENAEDDADD